MKGKYPENCRLSTKKINGSLCNVKYKCVCFLLDRILTLKSAIKGTVARKSCNKPGFMVTVWPLPRHVSIANGHF